MGTAARFPYDPALEQQMLSAGDLFVEPAPKRQVPTEFRIFHAGVNHSMKGDFLFDEDAAKLVMADYEKRGLPLMMDYEHQSVSVPPVVSIASATEFVPEIRRDKDGGPELWATRIQWTEDARQQLEKGQYRLFSPLFLTDKNNPPRVRSLQNVTLTNLPALDRIRPLVAATAASAEGEKPMEPNKELEELKAKLTAAEEKLTAMAAEHVKLCQWQTSVNETFQKKLGKSFDDWAAEESAEHEDGAESEEAKATKALTAAALTLTGAKTPEEAIGKLTALTTERANLIALKAKVEKDAAEALDKEFTTALDAAVVALKIPPAVRPLYVALGAAKGLEAVKLAMGGESIAHADDKTRQEATPQVALTAAEAEIAGRVGLKLDTLQQFKAQQRAGQ